MALFPAIMMAKESADTISVRRAFVEMPEDIIDLLTRDTRMDMLDYFDADSTYVAVNNLRGPSEIMRLTSDFMGVRVTPSSTLQLKVLKMKNGGDIVMAIYTIGEEGNTMESEIRFFDSNMKELPADKFFKTPKLSDFFDTKGYQTSMKEIEEMIPYYTVAYDAGPDNAEITARLALGDILTVEDEAIVSLLMKPALHYAWNGKKFIVTRATER